jgi:transcriptional regulator with XRE-family HTH domain
LTRRRFLLEFSLHPGTGGDLERETGGSFDGRIRAVIPSQASAFDIFGEEGCVSHFGALVKKLRHEKNLTLEAVARRIGSHKGYVSGIENDKVNPPSVKIIRRYAKVLGQDARMLVRLAWVDKAPPIIRQDAERFLEWYRINESTSEEKEFSISKT